MISLGHGCEQVILNIFPNFPKNTSQIKNQEKFFEKLIYVSAIQKQSK